MSYLKHLSVDCLPSRNWARVRSKHPRNKQLRVTLPWHGRDLKRGTLGSIIHQAGYTKAKFLDLLKC